MAILKPLALGVVLTLAVPFCSFANGDPVITNEAIARASVLDISREQAIGFATQFAECAGFLQAGEDFERSEGRPAQADVNANLVTTYHTAAILIWSKYGTSFTQIKAIKKDSAKAFSAAYPLAFNSLDDTAQESLREKLAECREIAKLAGAISGFAIDPEETEWK